jgi:hypothetical protein
VRYGVWRSLVARFVRDEEVAGSNPVTPTNFSGQNLILEVELYLSFGIEVDAISHFSPYFGFE